MRIIHISDTPSQIYPFIYKTVKQIKPDYVIHTGDIADEIKLEFYPERVNQYSVKVKDFIINITSLSETFFVIGNHDSLHVVNIYARKNVFYNQINELKIGNVKFLLTHKIYPFLIAETKYDFILFGHNKTELDNNKFLNGLNYIRLIDTDTKTSIKLSYPIYTNYLRYPPCDGALNI